MVGKTGYIKTAKPLIFRSFLVLTSGADGTSFFCFALPLYNRRGFLLII
jgi:hypothetical protein